MDVVVAGGHGQIAMLLHPLLVARGDRVRGLIRNPAQADAVRAAGAEPVVFDLEAEADPSPVVRGGDAIVFAAGAGPGSGAARKESMDLGGALKCITAAQATGVRRFVMVSAMGAERAADAPAGGDVFAVYLRAKGLADDALLASGLAATVVRPGRLTDDAPTGRVRVAPTLPPGAIPRADVAAVLAAVLADDGTIGAAFDVVAGSDAVPDALRGLRT